ERERRAARQQEPPRTPGASRVCTGFWYQAGAWPQPRWVVAKAEGNDRGTHRRFVVANRPRAVGLPEPTYDEYAAGGEGARAATRSSSAIWRWTACASGCPFSPRIPFPIPLADPLDSPLL